MRSFFTLTVLMIFSFSQSNAEISGSKKEKLVKCLGLYAAHSFLTQDKLSLANIEHSLGGKKFLSILWGFGLACKFFQVCKNRKCLVYKAPKKDKM